VVVHRALILLLHRLCANLYNEFVGITKADLPRTPPSQPLGQYSFSDSVTCTVFSGIPLEVAPNTQPRVGPAATTALLAVTTDVAPTPPTAPKAKRPANHIAPDGKRRPETVVISEPVVFHTTGSLADMADGYEEGELLGSFVSDAKDAIEQEVDLLWEDLLSTPGDAICSRSRKRRQTSTPHLPSLSSHSAPTMNALTPIHGPTHPHLSHLQIRPLSNSTGSIEQQSTVAVAPELQLISASSPPIAHCDCFRADVSTKPNDGASSQKPEQPGNLLAVQSTSN
jgi:hypothetical protein